MHSFEVSLGYENVVRTTFSKMYFGQRFHIPNETSKECIQFLNVYFILFTVVLSRKHNFVYCRIYKCMYCVYIPSTPLE